MNLEELMVIWDSQNKEPLFALNEGALHSIVRRRNETMARHAVLRYSLEISVGLLSGCLMVIVAAILSLGHPRWTRVPISGWDVVSLIIAGAIWFYYAAYMNHARRIRLKKGEGYESTIRGDIDRSIAQIAYQLRIDEGILWRGLVPIWIGSGLWCFTLFRLVAAPVRIYPIMGVTMAVAFAWATYIKNANIRRHSRPMRRELESLRQKLSEKPPQSA